MIVWNNGGGTVFFRGLMCMYSVLDMYVLLIVGSILWHSQVGHDYRDEWKHLIKLQHIQSTTDRKSMLLNSDQVKY